MKKLESEPTQLIGSKKRKFPSPELDPTQIIGQKKAPAKKDSIEEDPTQPLNKHRLRTSLNQAIKDNFISQKSDPSLADLFKSIGSHKR
jgi:hypothetical protein